MSAVHVTLAYHQTFQNTVARIMEWNDRFQADGDFIMFAKDARDIDKARATNRTAIFFGLQTPMPIEDDLGLIEVLHALGVRFMQLTYNNQSLLGCGWMEDWDGGITRMGRQAIKEMNRLGMVVDMSHAGERTTLAAIDLSERPIAVTHANPAWWCPSKRGKSRPVLKALGARHGMLGLSLYPHHLEAGSQTTLESFCRMAAEAADVVGDRQSRDRIGPLPGPAGLDAAMDAGRPLEPGRGRCAGLSAPTAMVSGQSRFPKVGGGPAPGRILAKARSPAFSARTGTGSCAQPSRQHRRCIEAAVAAAAAPASATHGHRRFHGDEGRRLLFQGRPSGRATSSTRRLRWSPGRSSACSPPMTGSPLRVADFGCADGGTSLEMWRNALAFARRLVPSRPIEIVYTDLPRNDFSQLFRTIHNQTELSSYYGEVERHLPIRFRDLVPRKDLSRRQPRPRLLRHRLALYFQDTRHHFRSRPYGRGARRGTSGL